MLRSAPFPPRRSTPRTLLAPRIRYVEIVARHPELRDASRRVLEIDGGATGLAGYLQRAVTCVDTAAAQPPAVGRAPVVAAATRLPFAAAAFDDAVWADGLQSLPSASRAPAIAELIRVAGRRAIIALAAGVFAKSAEAAWAEDLARSRAAIPAPLQAALRHGIPAFADSRRASARASAARCSPYDRAAAGTSRRVGWRRGTIHANVIGCGCGAGHAGTTPNRRHDRCTHPRRRPRAATGMYPMPVHPLRLLRRLATLGLAAACLCAGQATATTVLPLDLDQIVAGAAEIVHVRCLANESVPDTTVGVATLSTFVVLDRAKGNANSTLTIRQAGGALGGVVVNYRVPKFTPGEEYVLFMPVPSRAGLASPVGLAQGAFSVRASAAGKDVGNGRDFAELLPGSRAPGIAAPAAGPAANNRMALGEFMTLVRARAGSR